jgi:hypothetical protein
MIWPRFSGGRLAIAFFHPAPGIADDGGRVNCRTHGSFIASRSWPCQRAKRRVVSWPTGISLNAFAAAR